MVCLSSKGVWFGYWVRQVLVTHSGLRFVSILPSAGIYKWGPPHLTKSRGLETPEAGWKVAMVT